MSRFINLSSINYQNALYHNIRNVQDLINKTSIIVNEYMVLNSPFWYLFECQLLLSWTKNHSALIILNTCYVFMINNNIYCRKKIDNLYDVRGRRSHGRLVIYNHVVFLIYIYNIITPTDRYGFLFSISLFSRNT